LTILVSGEGRGSGKTRAACDIISQTSDARWTAIKVTSHGHGVELTDPVIFEESFILEGRAGPATDTARYLAAGAARALWVRCSIADIERALHPLIKGNVILESNSAVGIIPTDLIIFIAAEVSTEAKPSAQVAAGLADIKVTGYLRNQDLERVRTLLYHCP
jgi:hypothetical protein